MSLAVNNRPTNPPPVESLEDVKQLVKKFKANKSFSRALNDLDNGKPNRMLVLARQNNIEIPKGGNLLEQCTKIGKAMGASNDLVVKLVEITQKAKQQIAELIAKHELEMKKLEIAEAAIKLKKVTSGYNNKGIMNKLIKFCRKFVK